MQLQFLISGNNDFSRVNIARQTAAEALKEAKQLLGRGYMDVRICTPRGQVLLPDDFDQLDATGLSATAQRTTEDENEQFSGKKR